MVKLHLKNCNLLPQHYTVSAYPRRVLSMTDLGPTKKFCDFITHYKLFKNTPPDRLQVHTNTLLLLIFYLARFTRLNSFEKGLSVTGTALAAVNRRPSIISPMMFLCVHILIAIQLYLVICTIIVKSENYWLLFF